MHRGHLGFDITYVISKEGAHPRKERIVRALAVAGIQFEFVDAIMGTGLSADQLREVYDEAAALRHKTIPRKLHPSHIGCNLSHRAVYTDILQCRISSALVLEDDAEPLPGQFAAVERAHRELPADWDLLYLGRRGHERAPRTFWFKWLLHPLLRLARPGQYRLTAREMLRLYARPYSNHLYRAGYHQGTHAYAVSAKGAAILLENTLPVTAPADATIGTLILEGKLNAFALRENAFTTSGEASQIVSAI